MALVGLVGLAALAGLVEMFAVDIVYSLKSYAPTAMKRSTGGFVAVATAATVATTPDKFVEFV